MDWVRLDAGFTTHPKIAKVGPIGGWLFVEGMCYAGLQRTDGFIPTEALPRLLLALKGVAMVEDSRRKGKLRRTMPADQVDWPARLVEAGLWEVTEGGYRIHNYLVRNPTGEYLEELSTIRSEAGRRGGVQSGVVRRLKQGSKTQANPEANVEARNVTLRNEEKPLFFSGSNGDQSPAEPSPEAASREETLTPEQVKDTVQQLVRGVLRPKP